MLLVWQAQPLNCSRQRQPFYSLYVVSVRLRYLLRRLHSPEMSNLRPPAAEIRNHPKKFVYVHSAAGLLGSLAFGSSYRFFIWFNFSFRQNPSVVPFALNDCDGRLRVTANHDATSSYNRYLPRSAHTPFITALREPRLRCDHRQRCPCVNRGLNAMSYRFYKTDNEGEASCLQSQRTPR